MNRFIEDEWKIIEDGFSPETNRFSESIFTLGNEHMGLRGFFEEQYTGDSLQGTYIAGVFYPDKTKVGWWKIGYPEFFAKVINSTNWIGIDIEINGTRLDLGKSRFKKFRRELDMKNACLTRSIIWMGEHGEEIAFEFSRFLSMAKKNIACISLSVRPINFKGILTILPYLNGDVRNEDANYKENFWRQINQGINNNTAWLTMETKKTGFHVCTAMSTDLIKLRTHPGISQDNLVKSAAAQALHVEKNKYVGYKFELPLQNGEEINFHKYVAVCSSRDFSKNELEKTTLHKLKAAKTRGYNELYREHQAETRKKWQASDITITGDLRAQQGIRYCIFQLIQTYTGRDSRLNLGPKGFSGEKYGGVVYWDTEAFCFPFYLYTNEKSAKNLLLYRYRHLEKAKENAAKLGLKGALYPMVTIDGQECHNEWEITFEEIHRNAAIAYAIYNYTRYTGDYSYLHQYGIKVLVELCRFWADRVTYNPQKDRYMILGVTGPNEYENNVNNNWYTNTMAAWTLEYTLDTLEKMTGQQMSGYAQLNNELQLTEGELAKWREIIQKMYYPYVEALEIFEQNDLYMDKEQNLVEDLPPTELPLNKHWSWDRILRSCFIKQADVVQGLYFLRDSFNPETIKRNFDFYEPRTVHESSLSPSIHSIVASRIGYKDKAYKLYLRTARLDLDNYNDDTDEGIHLTSMAGSWLAIVEGFAGVTIKKDILSLSPYLPPGWESYSFQLIFRGRSLQIMVVKEKIVIKMSAREELLIKVSGKEHLLQPEKTAWITRS